MHAARSAKTRTFVLPHVGARLKHRGIGDETATAFFLLIHFFSTSPRPISFDSLHRPFPCPPTPLHPNRWPPSNGALTPDVQSQCRLGDQLGSVCQWFR